MKKLLVIAFGVLSLNLSTVDAVDYENIFTPTNVEHSIEACSDFITETPLTQKIEEDEDAFRNTTFIQPLLNLDRMERSIPEGECVAQRSTVRKFIDFFNFRVNNGLPLAVYGRSAQTMNYFTSNPRFIYVQE